MKLETLESATAALMSLMMMMSGSVRGLFPQSLERVVAKGSFLSG